MKSNYTVDDNNTAHGSCDENKILCRVCVRNSLKPYFEKRNDAYNEWLIERKKCAHYFESTQQQQQSCSDSDPKATTSKKGHDQYYDYNEILQLNERRKVLKEQLSKLQMDCSNEAVALYKLRAENDERTIQIQKQREVVMNQKNALNQMRQLLLLQQQKQDGVTSEACNDNGTNSESESGASVFLSAIQETKEKIKRIRFGWAIQAFLMYKIQVDDQQQQPTRTNVTGIGKICGLPLPNKGLELYSFLPPNELQSALRLVASITSIVSSCLAIQLPHPILLRPLQSSVQQQQQQQPSFISILPTQQAKAAQSKQTMMNRHPYYKYQDYIDHDIAVPVGSVSLVTTPECNNTAARAIQQYHQPQLPNHHRHQQHQQQQQIPIKSTQPIMGFSSLLQSVGNMIVSQQPQTTPVQHQRPHEIQQQHSPSFPSGGTAVSMDPEKVRMRLYHSSTAVIAEDSTFQSAYTLKWNDGTTNTNSNSNNKLPSKSITTSTPSKRNTTGMGTNAINGGGESTLKYTSTMTNSSSKATGNSTPRRIISPFSSTNTNTRSNSATHHNNNNGSPDTNSSSINDHINIVEDFVVALQLLQNNIITLCIRVGVPVDRLWPAVAVLLNLNELYLFLCEEIK